MTYSDAPTRGQMTHEKLFGGGVRRASWVALVVAAAVVVTAGPSAAAPTRGHNTFEPIYMCGGAVLVFITPSTGANTGWAVNVSGQTADRPFHVKWFSVRVYDGAFDVEPTTPPLFATEKSYGARNGQGEPVRCTGQHTEAGPDPVTVFLDADLTRL
jgi:hypothetical protein